MTKGPLVPPTNCTCTWAKRSRSQWSRVKPKPGCKVHGPVHQHAIHTGHSSATLAFRSVRPAGITVQDILDIAVDLIDTHADPSITLRVRIGWHNNLKEIHVQPRDD